MRRVIHAVVVVASSQLLLLSIFGVKVHPVAAATTCASAAPTAAVSCSTEEKLLGQRATDQTAFATLSVRRLNRPFDITRRRNNRGGSGTFCGDDDVKKWKIRSAFLVSQPPKGSTRKSMALRDDGDRAPFFSATSAEASAAADATLEKDAEAMMPTASSASIADAASSADEAALFSPTFAPKPGKGHDKPEEAGQEPAKDEKQKHRGSEGVSSSSSSDSSCYDQSLYDAYASTMEEVLQSRRILKSGKGGSGGKGRGDVDPKAAEDLEAVKRLCLLSSKRVSTKPLLISSWFSPSSSGEADMKGNDGGAAAEPVNRVDEDKEKEGADRPDDAAEAIKQASRLQKSLYLNATNLTWDQYKMAQISLTYLGDHCAKHRLAKPLIVAWEKLKEAGMIPRENSLSTYLYVLSTYGEDNKEAENAATETATFHDMLYSPNEKTISLRIKSMVSKGDADGAEALLEWDASDATKHRQRTFLPVLQLHCDQGNVASALRLYDKMHRCPGVVFESETHANFIASLASHGAFRRDSCPIEGGEDIGYDPPCGPKLFDRLVSDMASDVLEISSASASVLRRGLLVGFDPRYNEISSDESLLEGTKALSALSTSEEQEVEDMVPDNTPSANSDELVACRVSIDPQTALCPQTNATLRLIMLGKEQHHEMHETLLKMATDQYEAYDAKLTSYKKKNKRPQSPSSKKGGRSKSGISGDSSSTTDASEELSKFAKWLETREGEPFTAIVDGANVAYYSFGRINYFQLHYMVNALIKKGENPLVIMPAKYCRKQFYIRQGSVQKLLPDEVQILEGLSNSGRLYKVPPRCLDDYYWMLASVSDQTTSRAGRDLDVPPNNSDGRWPGLRPLLISNDQMRDHRLDLLEERLFRRWCSCHIVNYEFTPTNLTDPWSFEDRDVKFCSADFFSKEIQGNPTTTATTMPGLEGKAMAWHFPVTEWDEHDRFCIRLPTQHAQECTTIY